MEPSEQAPSTRPPKRRRRRWLIVAFVLVLSIVAWWQWPRGDARFVGLWHQLVWTMQGSPINLRFARDGSGSAIDPDGTSRPLEWAFDNAVFAVTLHPVPKWRILYNRVMYGSPWDAEAKAWTKFNVERIDKSQIVVRKVGGSFPEVFTRIPE